MTYRVHLSTGLHGKTRGVVTTSNRADVTCEKCLLWNAPDGWYEWTRAEQQRFRTYGLTRERFAEFVEAQGRGCGICRKPLEFMEVTRREFVRQTFYVDHDHKTGEVRGVLCARCNGLLAGLDDAEFRVAAEAYLRKGSAVGS